MAQVKSAPPIPWKIGDPFPWEKTTATPDKAAPIGDENGPLSGKHGILSGVMLGLDALASPVRPDQEADQRVFDLIDVGAKQEAELSAAEQRQAVGDGLEAAIRPHLRDEIKAEKDSGGTAEQRRQDFQKLRECCAKWDLPLNLPHEPAPWTGVAALLIQEGEHGIEHVTRLRNSISFSHRSFNLPDPTADHIINAILRSIANRKDLASA
jgi:hypothetical protein